MNIDYNNLHEIKKSNSQESNTNHNYYYQDLFNNNSKFATNLKTSLDHMQTTTSSILNKNNSNLNIFEAKPLNQYDEHTFPSSLPRRWRYIDKFNTKNSIPDSKNEIITSNELLKRDRFEIDLIKVSILFVVIVLL